MLTFFFSTFTCSTAVHIALEEAGIPFNGTEVSWKRGLNVKELEAVNPMGQVPTLVDGDRVLTQMHACLEYIADHGKKKLLPELGTWERTQATRWLAFLSADLQKNFGPIFRASTWTKSEEAQNDIKTAFRGNIEKALAQVDAHLKGRDFMLGKSFSVVDAHLFIVTGWCKMADVKIGGKYPNLMAFMKRVNELPSVKKVLAAEGMNDYVPA
jgi:glutathione S-transferase